MSLRFICHWKKDTFIGIVLKNLASFWTGGSSSRVLEFQWRFRLVYIKAWISLVRQSMQWWWARISEGDCWNSSPEIQRWFCHSHGGKRVEWFLGYPRWQSCICDGRTPHGKSHYVNSSFALLNLLGLISTIQFFFLLYPFQPHIRHPKWLVLILSATYPLGFSTLWKALLGSFARYFHFIAIIKAFSMFSLLFKTPSQGRPKKPQIKVLYRNRIYLLFLS